MNDRYRAHWLIEHGIVNSQPAKDARQQEFLILKALVYLIFLSILGGITWKYPFLFELPLIAAIAGAYWVFFREPDQNTKP